MRKGAMVTAKANFNHCVSKTTSNSKIESFILIIWHVFWFRFNLRSTETIFWSPTAYIRCVVTRVTSVGSIGQSEPRFGHRLRKCNRTFTDTYKSLFSGNIIEPDLYDRVHNSVVVVLQRESVLRRVYADEFLRRHVRSISEICADGFAFHQRLLYFLNDSNEMINLVTKYF